MMTDEEKGQVQPEEGASQAGRESFSDHEGNSYRRAFNSDGYTPRSYNNEGGYQRRSYNSEGGYQRRSYNSEGGYQRRSYNNNGEGGYQRRSYNNNGEGGYQRRSYNNDGEGGYQRRSYNNGEGGYQRRPYNNYGEGGYQRRSYNNEQRTAFNQNSASATSTEENSGETGAQSGNFERPYRPYNNNGYQRRSYNNNGEGGYQRRSYNNGEGGYQRRPFNNHNSEGGYQGRGGYRPRPQFGEEPARDYGFRADGRPRRNRIGSSRSRNTPEWLAENEFQAPRYAPTLDPSVPIRLNKFLANAGICSRREADEFIMAGVVKVNGEVASELGVKVLPTDEIMFHDQPVKIERKVYILLNKPKDCVTTSEDPQERLTVMDLVKDACQERIYPVGRLDRNTTGVLLLTNDGDLASKLAHPKYEKRKIYQATLDKELSEETMAEIAKGVDLDGEHVDVDEISYVGEKKEVIGIEIHSGQNRVVRRIFEQFGFRVYKLDRVYFAGLTKKNLPRGKWRNLTQHEVSLLKMGQFA